MSAISRWGRPVPLWLTPAAIVWLVLLGAMLGTCTSFPVNMYAWFVLIAFALLAHGFVHQRWRIVAPLAVLVLAWTVLSVGEFLPGATSLASATTHGPIDQAWVGYIWATAFVVCTFDIAVGLIVNAKSGSAKQREHGDFRRYQGLDQVC